MRKFTSPWALRRRNRHAQTNNSRSFYCPATCLWPSSKFSLRLCWDKFKRNRITPTNRLGEKTCKSLTFQVLADFYPLIWTIARHFLLTRFSEPVRRGSRIWIRNGCEAHEVWHRNVRSLLWTASGTTRWRLETWFRLPSPPSTKHIGSFCSFLNSGISKNILNSENVCIKPRRRLFLFRFLCPFVTSNTGNALRCVTICGFTTAWLCASPFSFHMRTESSRVRPRCQKTTRCVLVRNETAVITVAIRSWMKETCQRRLSIFQNVVRCYILGTFFQMSGEKATTISDMLLQHPLLPQSVCMQDSFWSVCFYKHLPQLNKMPNFGRGRCASISKQQFMLLSVSWKLTRVTKTRFLSQILRTPENVEPAWTNAASFLQNFTR